MRRLIGEGRTVESCCTDPPYHLLSIVKRFGKKGSAPAKHGTDGAFNRISRGFADQQWDGFDKDGKQIAHDPKLWRLVFDLLLPGGFLLAFSSPKTGHRMACAIEDAGFTMHPFIGWIYGQGLPKPHSLGNGNGWYHGGQTLRPALEPVYFAQRPFSERTGVANFARHGVGGFNIEACRLEVDPEKDDPRLGGKGDWIRERGKRHPYSPDLRPSFPATERRVSAVAGKWPTTVAHDGSPAVLDAFPADLAGHSLGKYFPAFGYNRKAKGKDRADSDHPTVKPIEFLEWLIRLVTPEGGTVLDPFAGTGTTGIAARNANCNAILIENNPAYVADIRRRIGYERGADIL